MVDFRSRVIALSTSFATLQRCMVRWSRLKNIAFFLISSWIFRTTAHAELIQGYNVQNIRPTLHPKDLIVLAPSQAQEHFSPAIGAFLQYNFDPLLLYGKKPEDTIHLVRHRFQLDLGATMGISRWFEVGVYLPIILFQQSDSLQAIGREERVQSTLLGDLSISGKVPLLQRQEEQKGFGLALSLRTFFPTGSAIHFTGDGMITFHPTAILDYRFANQSLFGLQTGVFVRLFLAKVVRCLDGIQCIAR